MTVQIFAHRGSSDKFAEHTRAAYLQALSDGADGVECDLHLSADGELVLLHDDDVSRTSNGTGEVGDLTLAQLRAFDFCSWKGASIPAEYGDIASQLLTLEEILDILVAADRPLGFAIEFKYGAVFDPNLVDATLARLRARGWESEHSIAGNLTVSFMSFHPDAVKYLAERVPSAQLCQLLEVIAGSDVAEELDVGPIAGHTMAFLMRRAMAEGERLVDKGVAGIAGPGVEFLRANPKKGQRWQASGKRFRVWTVDTEEDLALCQELGVTEVTTNRPAEIRALLETSS